MIQFFYIIIYNIIPYIRVVAIQYRIIVIDYFTVLRGSCDRFLFCLEIMIKHFVSLAMISSTISTVTSQPLIVLS